MSFVGPSGIDCTVCKRIFTTPSAAVSHLAKAHDILQGAFPLGNESFESSSNDSLESNDDGMRSQAAARVEMPMPAKKQVHPCLKCGEPFGQKNDLLGHIYSKHFTAEQQLPGREDINSQECSNASQSKGQKKSAMNSAFQRKTLAHHLSELVPDATAQKKLDCGSCGRVFQKTCGLSSHERACKNKVRLIVPVQ